MTIRTSAAFANLQLGTSGTSINGSLNSALSHGILMLYSGSQPPSPDSAATGSLLAVVTLAGGGFTDGSPSNGLTLGQPSGWTAAGRAIGIPQGSIWSCIAGATGTIGWARFRGNAYDPMTQDTTYIYPRIDFSVGITSGDIQISNVNVTGTGFNTTLVTTNVYTGYQGNTGGTPLTVTGVNLTA